MVPVKCGKVYDQGYRLLRVLDKTARRDVGL
jgi:hypothetical protein